MRKNKVDNFMLYIPVIKHTNWEINNGKVRLIFYHNKLIERFVRVFAKKPSVSYIELDEIGTEVWLNIDGKKHLYDISKLVEQKFVEDNENMPQRIAMFFKHLCHNGWVKFRYEKE